MKNPSADRFMIQLLLYRYEVLLNQLSAQFSLSEEQKAMLREKILTVSWVQNAFVDQTK
jgi:hypothetical protein